MESARNLGVVVQNDLKMDIFVNNICRSTSFALYRIGQIRKFLDKKCTEMLVHAFITCRLDQCNSLLYALPESQITKLQRIQNSAARLVSLSRKYDHLTPILHELHWLPVKYRIIYKILLLTYKCLHGMGPIYLQELLKEYKPSQSPFFRAIIYAWVKPGRDIVLMVFSFLLHLLLLLLLKTFLCSPVTQKLK